MSIHVRDTVNHTLSQLWHYLAIFFLCGLMNNRGKRLAELKEKVNFGTKMNIKSERSIILVILHR